MTDDADAPEVDSPTAEMRRAVSLAEVVGLDRARYDRQELLDRAGLDNEDSKRWWRAMGLVEVPEDVVAFGHDDLAMVRALKLVLSQDEDSEEHIFRLARLLGASFSRIAEAQVEVVDDLLRAIEDIGGFDTTEHRTVALQNDAAHELINVFEQSMLYVWRRQLYAALGRWIGADDDLEDQTIGFVDISGFTSLSKKLPSEDLTELVERFESGAVEVVSARDGRVVKFIGDEALFVMDDLGSAVDAALELCEKMAEGDPPVSLHCGVACGPAVTIGGDVFGDTVNLAKRLTDVARRDKIVMTKEAVKALGHRDDLVVHRVRRAFELKGFGRTQLVSVGRKKSADGEAAETRGDESADEPRLLDATEELPMVDPSIP